MFEFGTRVVCTQHQTGSDSTKVPLGATGTVIGTDGPGYVYVDWDNHVNFYDGYDHRGEDGAIYDNVWCIHTTNLLVIEGSGSNDELILLKIKTLNEKFKNKQLKLRKVKSVFTKEVKDKELPKQTGDKWPFNVSYTGNAV